MNNTNPFTPTNKSAASRARDVKGKALYGIRAETVSRVLERAACHNDRTQYGSQRLSNSCGGFLLAPLPLLRKQPLILDEIQHRPYVNFDAVMLEAPGERRFRL